MPTKSARAMTDRNLDTIVERLESAATALAGGVHEKAALLRLAAMLGLRAARQVDPDAASRLEARHVSGEIDSLRAYLATAGRHTGHFFLRAECDGGELTLRFSSLPDLSHRLYRSPLEHFMLLGFQSIVVDADGRGYVLTPEPDGCASSAASPLGSA